jgi:hypothetical protein
MAPKYHRPDNLRLAVMLTRGNETATETRAVTETTAPKPIVKTDTLRSAPGIGNIASRRAHLTSRFSQAPTSDKAS